MTKEDFDERLTKLCEAKLEVLKNANVSEKEWVLYFDVLASEVEMYCLLSGVAKYELVGAPPFNAKNPTIWDEMCVALSLC